VHGGEVILQLGVPELVDGPSLAQHTTVQRDLEKSHEAALALPSKQESDLGKPQGCREPGEPEPDELTFGLMFSTGSAPTRPTRASSG
jgi:hypothetical protein